VLVNSSFIPSIVSYANYSDSEETIKIRRYDATLDESSAAAERQESEALRRIEEIKAETRLIYLSVDASLKSVARVN
jgi:hypothetical protein